MFKQKQQDSKMKLICARLVYFSLLAHLSYAFLDLFKRSSSIELVQPEQPAVHQVRGVPEHLLARYESDPFVCDAGKTVLNKSSINDGYCDCSDGSDEPGTSACANAWFTCLNKGYKYVKITSSKVDDTVCDCCDGSDEDSTIKCPNTCKQKAEKERAGLELVTINYKKGSAIRDGLIRSTGDKRQALLLQEQQQSVLLAQLEQELQRVRGDLDQRLSAINTQSDTQVIEAETTVRTLLGLNTAAVQYSGQFLAALCEVLDIDQTKLASLANVTPPAEPEDSEEHDDADVSDDIEDDFYGYDASSSAQARIMASCGLVMAAGSELLIPLCEWPLTEALAKTNTLLVAIMKAYKPFSEVMLLLGYKRQHGKFAGAAAFARSFLADSAADTCPQAFEALPQACELKDELKEAVHVLDGVQSLADADPEMQRLRNLQSTLERQQRDTQTAKNSAQSSLQDIERYAGYLEFLALKEQCFEVVDGKFSYSLCIMGQVTQKEQEGSGNTVTLGSFQSFEESEEGGSYVLKMQYGKGQHCHAFGARSAEVTVRCAEKNLLIRASEPSTCAYALLFESPAACSPKHAQANGIQL